MLEKLRENSKDRLNNHRSDIKLNKNTSTSLHFNDINHTADNLKIIPPEHTPNYTEEERKSGEKYWIGKLKTQYPRGLNYYPPLNKKNPHLALRFLGRVSN